MKWNKYMTWAISLVILTGCGDFLEEYSQDTYYATSYEDLDELLIGDCYIQVKPAQRLGRTDAVGYFLNYLADEIEEQNNGYNMIVDAKERIFGYYTWQQRPGAKQDNSGFLAENGTWTEVYRLINVANNIIESVEKVPQQLDVEKLGVARVRGEAHFLRGYYYFWLVNLYAKPYQRETASKELGIPIKNNAEVKDVIFKRNTLQEVYDQVLADLDQAERDLGQTGVAKSIYRADLTALNFLKSRVYLFMQNWEKAVEYADKVIKVRPQLTDLNHLEGGFLAKTSVETIFSMGNSEIMKDMDWGPQGFRVSHELYDAYEDADLRKSLWWWTYEDFIGYTKCPIVEHRYNEEDPTNENYYFYNYNYVDNFLFDVSDKFLFRTAEAYLIKAEAEAYQGHEVEARGALNALRKYRYQTGADYQVEAAGEALVRAIREERYLELALEGHRWFDLRRYSVCEKYPHSKPIVHEYTYYASRASYTMTKRYRYVLEENDAGYTLPIPHEVIDYNVGMPNNERPERKYSVIPLN